MHGFVEAFNRCGAEWSTLVVDLVWQSTLVALLVVGVTYVLARPSPAVRYWLWQLVAIKLLILPLWSLPLALSWMPAATPMPSIVSHDNTMHVGDVPPSFTAPGASGLRRLDRSLEPRSKLSWQGCLFAGWAAVVLLQTGRLGLQRVRLARLLRQTTEGDERLVGTVGRTAARMGLKRAPRAVTTDLECSPFVCGILRPTLVLPRALAGSLNATELEQVVAHELAHVLRRDLVWGWIPQIAKVLYFFHPVAHLASYRIRLERELACDQVAMIVAGRGPAEYAQTLVRVLGSSSHLNVFRTSATTPLDGGAIQSTSPEQEP
jgi:bla regulator protein blaR1